MRKVMLIEHEHAILEGFSLAVAATIASGQINPVLGIHGVERKAYFHENLLVTLDTLWNDGDRPIYGSIDWPEFVCALLFTYILWACSTSKRLNGGGRAPRPWLFFMGVAGVLIGLALRYPQ